MLSLRQATLANRYVGYIGTEILICYAKADLRKETNGINTNIQNIFVKE